MDELKDKILGIADDLLGTRATQCMSVVRLC